MNEGREGPPRDPEEPRPPETATGGAGGGNERPPRPPRGTADREDRNRRERRGRGNRNVNENLGEENLEKMRDYLNVVERYGAADKKLLLALFLPDKFEEYVIELHAELEGSGFTGDDLNIELSEVLGERIKLLVGRLYQTVDESDPAEFWEEAERKGGIWNNIEILSATLRLQLEKLRLVEWSEDSLVTKLQYYKNTGITYDLQIETQSPYDEIEGGGVTGIETRKFTQPFYKKEKVESFSDFMLTVKHGVDEEIGVRKFLHNARALPHHPPGEGGYYAQLAKYAEDLMPSSSIDILFTLPDFQEILAASQLWDKLYETNFAKYDWIHQPAAEQLDPEYKLSETDLQALAYLRTLNPDLDDWRTKRALIMAIGDNYSLTMRAIETGAYADAPRSHDGGITYASYDKRDSALFNVFNPFAHTNLRWSNEGSLIGNLLFLPIEGLDIGKGLFDHTIFLEQMKKFMNSYVAGRPSSEADKKVLILANWINMARVGSIYTRGGWRDYYAYEGLLRPPGEQRLDVLESWKTIENIGVEVLKDFVDNQLTGGLPSMTRKGEFFGTDKDSPAEKVAKKDMRVNLAKYVYKKYVDPNVTATDLDAYIDRLENGDVVKNYKIFLYRGIAGAIKQRMPTKYFRLERNKSVVGGKRTWERLHNISDMPLEEFDQSFRDICAAEVELRSEISRNIRLGLKRTHKISEIDAGHYELTEEKLRNYMREKIAKNKDGTIDEARVERALKIYGKMSDIITDDYLKAFADKYSTPAAFPFAIAVEELDRSLLAHRAAGDRTPARAIGDIQSAEENIITSVGHYFDALMETYIDPAKNYDKLIELLKKMKKQMENMHGTEAAYKLMHHMAGFTISFFRKDDKAIMFPFKYFRMGKRNSLAAEFVEKPFRGKWDWELADCHGFLVELERHHLMIPEGFDANVERQYKKHGLIKKPDSHMPWTTNKIREDFNISKNKMSLEFLSKYVPLFFLVLLMSSLTRAAKAEAEGK